MEESNVPINVQLGRRWGFYKYPETYAAGTDTSEATMASSLYCTQPMFQGYAVGTTKLPQTLTQS